MVRVMAYLFSRLSKIVESEGEKFTVSPKLTEARPGDKVLTGGRIISVIPDFGERGETRGYIMTLDDDLDEVDTYLIPKVYEAYKDSLAVGNVVLVKGRPITIKFKGHPSDIVRKYVMVTALKEISPEPEE